MSSLLNASVTSASDVLSTASTEGICNVHTLPLEVFVISHGVTTTGNRAKVILESAVMKEAIGTIQIFAPFGKDSELLAEFPQGAVIDGAKAQDLGLYFKHSNGSNYQWISKETADQMMTLTGQNSNVMMFPEANARLSREQLQDAKNLTNGNAARVAVKNENRLGSVLSSIFG